MHRGRDRYDALNLTFAQVSVLLMLLLMRGGVPVAAPLVDRIRRRIIPSSWVAVGLTAVAVALMDVGGYALSGAAIASAAFYVAGYVGRFLGDRQHRQDR